MGIDRLLTSMSNLAGVLNNPDTLTSTANLAVALGHQGKHGAAEEITSS